MSQPTITAAQYLNTAAYLLMDNIDETPDGAADAAEIAGISDAAVEVLEPVIGWDPYTHIARIASTYAGHIETRYALVATNGA